jgi:ribonuclease BN (tRNA processing enzyme)
MVTLDQPGEGEGEGTVTVTFAGCGDAFGADLLIAEAYCWDKKVPHHLSHADLAEHERDLTARRVVLTHMSADMLARVGQARHEPTHDGLTMSL